jgi:hypothetical protein
MLGSFVLPAPRLAELERVLRAVDAAPEPSWSLSVLVGERLEQDLEIVAAARERFGEAATVSALEVAPLPASTIGALAERLPGDIPSFFEVALADDLEQRLEGVAAAGSFAKVRMGGVTAGAIPSAALVARFLEACRALGVPFKATAGLHHALRGRYPLTYEPGCASATMHGFLNLLGAALCVGTATATVARHDDLLAILDEHEASTFRFARRGLSWRAREWSIQEVARMRRGFFLSYGSCSFTEPVGELSALGVLDAVGVEVAGI